MNPTYWAMYFRNMLGGGMPFPKPPSFWSQFGPYAGAQGVGSLLQALAGSPQGQQTGINQLEDISQGKVEPINLNRAGRALEQQLLPQLNAQAPQINRRLGLDSGRGQFALWQALAGMRGRAINDLSLQNDLTKYQGRLSASQFLGSR